MWRNTDFIMDRKVVDITHIKIKFRSAFNPNYPHDAYKFLSHLINGVVRETVNFKLVESIQNNKRTNFLTYKFFESGIVNKCFGLLSGNRFKCMYGHLSEHI